MATGQVKKPRDTVGLTPSQTAAGLITEGQRAAGMMGRAVGSGLNRVNPNASVTPLRSPSETAVGLGQQAAQIPGHIGNNIASGLNSPYVPTNPTTPLRSPGEVLAGLGRELARAHDMLVPIGRPQQPQFSGLPPSPVDAINLHPLQGPNHLQAPQLNATGPQLGPSAPAPGPVSQPTSPLIQPIGQGLGPLAPQPGGFVPGQGMLAPNSPFDGVSHKPTVFASNAGLWRAVQDMHAANNPDRAYGPQAGPLSDPLKALLAGQHPATGPTGASNASAAYAASGRPMTNEEAQANYKNAPADSRYQPNTTVGGAFGRPTSNVDDLIRRDQGIARQGNFREAVLADMNGRTTGAVRPARDVDTPEAQAERASRGAASMARMGYVKNSRGSYEGSPGRARTPASPVDKEDRYHKLGLASPEERGLNLVQNRFAKADAKRINRGQMSFEEQLAMANPAANAQRQIGLGQIASANARNNATDSFQRAHLAQQGQRAESHDKTVLEAARIRAGLTGDTGKSVADKIAEGNDINTSTMNQGEVRAATAHLPPETQDRIMNEWRKQDVARQAFEKARGGPNSNPIGNFFAYPFDAIGSWLAGKPKDFNGVPAKVRQRQAAEKQPTAGG